MVASTAQAGTPPPVPRHIAIIMDGNGRWARRRALPRQVGHQAGLKPVRMTVDWCSRHQVDVLTLFAFSSENWQRPQAEVSGLMSLFIDALEREIEELDKHGVRLRFIGDRVLLDPALGAAIRTGEERTRTNTGLTLVVAVSYGGRWDIVQAARQLAAQVAAGQLDPGAIDEQRFGAALQTANLPAVDLLIRTGGEKRISNFLLWDIAYSEVCFSDLLWPDFKRTELERAARFFAERQRRFGRTNDQCEASSC